MTKPRIPTPAELAEAARLGKATRERLDGDETDQTATGGRPDGPTVPRQRAEEDDL
jgi:hypothetical protein